MAKRNGYIYVVKIDKNYKIGKTTNPKQRLGEYTRLFQMPEVVLLEYVKDYSKLELELHKMFKSKSLRGEWFQLSQLDLETIERILKHNLTEFSDEEIPNNKICIELTSEQSMKIKAKKFTKTMDKEKELVDLLLDSPSTYLAISIMKRYIVTNYNVLVKDGIKYGVQDLAKDMKISRQMASNHIRKLESINVLAKLETDRGKLFCINPKYYFRGEEVPESVLKLFEN